MFLPILHLRCLKVQEHESSVELFCLCKRCSGNIFILLTKSQYDDLSRGIPLRCMEIEKTARDLLTTGICNDCFTGRT